MDTDEEQRRIWFRREVLPLEPRLRNYLRKLGQREADIDDMTQDVLLRVLSYEQWRAVRSPLAFILTSARNVLVDELRRRKVVSIETFADLDILGRAVEAPGPEDSVLARDELRHLANAVAKLPQQCRRVFTLRKVYDFSPPQIAEYLGISVSTVEKHLVKALDLCAQYLADMDQPAPGVKFGLKSWAIRRHLKKT